MKETLESYRIHMEAYGEQSVNYKALNSKKKLKMAILIGTVLWNSTGLDN